MNREIMILTLGIGVIALCYSTTLAIRERPLGLAFGPPRIEIRPLPSRSDADTGIVR